MVGSGKGSEELQRPRLPLYEECLVTPWGASKCSGGVLLYCDAAHSVACPGRAVEVLVGLSTTAGL